MLSYTEDMVRVFPAGLSGIDPATDRPWGSYEKAIDAFERSRAIAAMGLISKPKCPDTELAKKRGPRLPRDSWEAKTFRLWQAGMTQAEIAVHFGVTQGAIHKRCKKLGLHFTGGRPPKKRD
jgi:hypothetical protein